MGLTVATGSDDMTSELQALGSRHPALRDEIYAQLLKQMTGNPSEQSALKLLALAAKCLESFLPTPPFFYFVSFFFASAAADGASFAASASATAHATMFRDDTAAAVLASREAGTGV